jgi:hypothetical protein
MAEAETTATTGQQQPFLRQGEDFESLYANNVQFQPSEWDIKVVFGELQTDAKDSASFVEQHTAITISWLQAKIMHYFLTLQLGVYEMSHGKIPIPLSVLPPVPETPPSELQGDPATKRVYDYIARTREEFFAQSPIIR